MEDLFVFLVSFIIIFIVYLVIYIVKRRRKKIRSMKEFQVLINRFKLNSNNLNYNGLALLFVLVNSFIIASTGTVVTMIDTNLIWQLLVSFVMLCSLIILFYSLIGFILKKKEGKKNENKKSRK